MRERRLAELELQPFDWYEHLREPARPLTGDEGERLFKREGARLRRYGGSLSVLSLLVAAPEVPRGEIMSRVGSLVAGAVRDTDFVVEGEHNELLVGLPGADAAAAALCVERIMRCIAELPSYVQAPVTVAAAQVGENESVEDTVARARRQRQG